MERRGKTWHRGGGKREEYGLGLERTVSDRGGEKREGSGIGVERREEGVEQGWRKGKNRE